MGNSFDLFSLLGVLIAIQTLAQLNKKRSQFWDERVTVGDRELATRIALFILVPVGVLLHEIGHSLATWQVGGEVVAFRWFYFSGYIIPSGDFSFAEDWWIFFAGNLVSILLAILPIPLIFSASKRIIGEIAYKFVSIQAVYSLVYYPLYSAATKHGDWIRIYDLNFQPVVSIVAIAHIGILGGLWQLYRSQRMVEWRLARFPNDLATWKQLKIESANRPSDLQPQLDLVYFLLEHDELTEAKRRARRIYRSYPQEISVKVLQVFIDGYNKESSTKVIKTAQKLLNCQLSDRDRVIIYRVLGSVSYKTGKHHEALDYVNRGLAIDPQNEMLLYHRAVIYYLLSEKDIAIANIDLAVASITNEDLRETLLQLRLNLD